MTVLGNRKGGNQMSVYCCCGLCGKRYEPAAGMKEACEVYGASELYLMVS